MFARPGVHFLCHHCNMRPSTRHEIYGEYLDAPKARSMCDDFRSAPWWAHHVPPTRVSTTSNSAWLQECCDHTLCMAALHNHAQNKVKPRSAPFSTSSDPKNKTEPNRNTLSDHHPHPPQLLQRPPPRLDVDTLRRVVQNTVRPCRQTVQLLLRSLSRPCVLHGP